MAGLGFPWAAVVTGAVSLVNAFVGSSSAKKQAKAQAAAQAAAQEKAIEAQKLQIQYEQAKQMNDLAMFQLMSQWQQAQQAQRAAELEAQQQAEKEKEQRYIKYGAIIATGFILYKAMKD